MIQPLLAATYKEGSGIKLRFPMLASVKLDGIRCVGLAGQVLTRKLKLVPNVSVRERLGIIDGLDGELIAGESELDEALRVPFGVTTSAVMSRDGTPVFTFWVFDDFLRGEGIGFQTRFEALSKIEFPPEIRVVPHQLVRDIGEMLEFEAATVAAGGEGIMLRSLDGRYKYGRSTEREGILFKVKRFEDAEGTIVGYEERMGNENEQERDERGYAKRSTRKEGRVGLGSLGGFIVENAEFGQFHVSTGAMKDADRFALWNERESLKGRVVKFKFQRCGVKDKPRIPTFLGFRFD